MAPKKATGKRAAAGKPAGRQPKRKDTHDTPEEWSEEDRPVYAKTDAEQIQELKHMLEQLRHETDERRKRDAFHRQVPRPDATPKQLRETIANLSAQIDEMNAGYRHSSLIRFKAATDNAKRIDDLVTRLASAREFCYQCQVRDQTFRLCPSCIDTLEGAIKQQRQLEAALTAERAEQERLDQLEKEQDEAHEAAELARVNKAKDIALKQAEKDKIARRLVDMAEDDVRSAQPHGPAPAVRTAVGHAVAEFQRQAVLNAPSIVGAVAAGAMVFFANYSKYR